MIYLKNKVNDRVKMFYLIDFTLRDNDIIIELVEDGLDLEFKVIPSDIVKWIENHIKSAQENADDDTIVEDEVIGMQTITWDTNGKYCVTTNN